MLSQSENFGAKNYCARVYACIYGKIVIRTHDTRHTTSTPPEHRTPEDERKPPGKRGTPEKQNL